jgi:hypothetical protein
MIEYTGQSCDVSGFHKDLNMMRNVPVASCATAITDDLGTTYMLQFDQVLYFGTGMDHSLINPNQIRITGTDVCDDPFDQF